MSDIPETPSTPEVPPTPPPDASAAVTPPVAETPTTESGLPPNIAAALAEFFSIVGGLAFYFIERKNPFIRFHALQSTYLGAIGVVVGIILPIIFSILAAIPVIGWLIGIILAIFLPIYGIAFFVVWLIAVISAFNGKEWEIPWIGKLARRHLAEGLLFYVKSPAI